MFPSRKLLVEVFSLITTATIENLQAEKQNSEYEGFTFQIKNQQFRSRLAKKTPKKKGYFVVFWEKDEDNENQAYSYTNSPEKTVISIIDEGKHGLFIFPKSVLLNKGILKTEAQKGKMAIRVYPAWETDLNVNAKKTQNWQQPYFIDLSVLMDLEKIKTLLEN